MRNNSVEGGVRDAVPFYMPKILRKLTIGFIIAILLWGVFLLIILPAVGIWFFLLGVGELVLYHLIKRSWNKRLNQFEKEPLKQYSYLNYVIMSWKWAMIMEFCVDFGAWQQFNPFFILVIMAVLTPVYLALFAAFRFCFRWFTYTPREAFLSVGAIGFLIESVILLMIKQEWLLIGLSLLFFPFAFGIHALNYGGAAVISTLKQNQVETRPHSKNWKKYLVGICFPLGVISPVLALNYYFIYFGVF